MVDSPGYCESIVRATDGYLLASFTGIGVYRFDEKWERLWDYPYPVTAGEHFAYLAECNGMVALAMATSHMTGTKPRDYPSSDSLWVSKAGKLQQVDPRQCPALLPDWP